MKRILLVYNPLSGKNSRRKSPDAVKAALEKAGAFDVTVYETKARGDATERAKRAEGFDVVAVCGGDGTLNEVLNGLLTIKKDERPSVLYIPGGTTNQTATAFRLPATLEGAAALLETGEEKAYDLGVFDGRAFVDVLAFGYGTESSLTTTQRSKNKFGFKAFLFNQVKYLFKIKPVHLKIEWDGGEMEDDFVFGNLLNVNMVSTFVKLADRGVAMDDGYLDLVLIKKVKNVWKMPGAFLRLVRKKFDGERSFVLRGTTFTLTAPEETAFLVDGERRQASGVLRVEVLPAAFRLLVPKRS